jgi:hypothetical protein
VTFFTTAVAKITWRGRVVWYTNRFAPTSAERNRRGTADIILE